MDAIELGMGVATGYASPLESLLPPTHRGSVVVVVEKKNMLTNFSRSHLPGSSKASSLLWMS